MIETILSRLSKVKRSGRGYVARCPAHEDRTPSLRITEADDGRILVHCFAGCGAAAIMEALSLSLSDLFPDGAITDHLRGVNAGRRDERKREHARLVLEIAQKEMEAGNKLSAKDIEDVRKAYKVYHEGE